MKGCAFLLALLAAPLYGNALKEALDKTGGDCGQKTDPPTLCPQGNDHWSEAELLAALPEFAKLYATRPIDVNKNGGNTNHMFAMWFAASRTKPKHIIESGVNMGQSTWLLRHAAPEAKIYSFDPIEFDKVKYKDPDSRTRYFLGENFTDIAKMDWDSWIPRAERSKTFVMLDDHMACTRRSQELQEFGFQHLWYDDNYKEKADCYSFNMICSPVTKPKQLTFMDYFGTVRKPLDMADHERNVAELTANIVTYFEFPAVFDNCPRNDRGHSLVKDKAELKAMGLPQVWHDRNKYLHLYPPYVQLKAKYPSKFS